MTPLEKRLYEALDSIIGDAGFEALREPKQRAILAALAQYKRQLEQEQNTVNY